MLLLRACALLCLIALPAHAAEPITADAINDASFAEPRDKGRDPMLMKLQVLLDRRNFSPGVIDGYWGGNAANALAAYEEANGLTVDGKPDQESWDRLAADTEPAFVTYTITEQDVQGPFVESIPQDFLEMSKLRKLSYTSVAEMLAERIHMDIKLLNELNPGADMNRAGTRILVANVPPAPTPEEARAAKADPAALADKLVLKRKSGSLRVLAADGRLMAEFPVTVGSDDMPSPSGTHTVKNVVHNPDFSYRPDVNFKQGDLDRNLLIRPGPNNPVGTVWIGLEKPTFGIHGTPEPSPVGKHFSHGCARLTNWDVERLAAMVKPGTVVVFED